MLDLLLLLKVNLVKVFKKGGHHVYSIFLFSVDEILEDLKAASPEDPVYTLNQELTRYTFPQSKSLFGFSCPPKMRAGGLKCLKGSG